MVGEPHVIRDPTRPSDTMLTHLVRSHEPNAIEPTTKLASAPAKGIVITTRQKQDCLQLESGYSSDQRKLNTSGVGKEHRMPATTEELMVMDDNDVDLPLKGLMHT